MVVFLLPIVLMGYVCTRLINIIIVVIVSIIHQSSLFL